MALIYFDGFRSYDNSVVDVEAVITPVTLKGSGIYIGTGYSRFGSPDRALFISQSTLYLILDDIGELTTVIFGFPFYLNDIDDGKKQDGYPFLYLRDNSVSNLNHLKYHINVDNHFEVTDGADSTLGTSSGHTISSRTWHMFETKAVISDTVGEVVINIDGTQVLHVSGEDTLNGSNAYCDRIRLSCPQRQGGNYDWYIDCLYLSDTTGSAPQNGFLGDVRCDVLRPNGAGSSTDFTPSAGSNYENVDETYPDDDSTYNDGDSSDKDTYALPSLSPATGATIYGVKSQMTVKNTDVGSREVKIITRSGGTDYSGETIAIDTAFKTHGKIYNNNPADSLAWEEADVTAMEVGIEVTG